MDAGLLKALGQALGIGGVALGVFFLLFREVIRKSIFPKLKKDDAYRLLRFITVLIWSVAVIGIAAWFWGERKAPEPSISTTGAQARHSGDQGRCPDRLQYASRGFAMKRQLVRSATAACALLLSAAGARAQEVRTQAPCSPVIDRTQGNVTLTFSGGCTVGIAPAEL